MINESELWMNIVKTHISEHAVLEDDHVYIRSAYFGIVEIPLFDPKIVLALMNDNLDLVHAAVCSVDPEDDEQLEVRFCVMLNDEALAVEDEDEAIAAMRTLHESSGLTELAELVALMDLIGAIIASDERSETPQDHDAIPAFLNLMRALGNHPLVVEPEQEPEVELSESESVFINTLFSRR
jgi:hypothetical protein